MRFARSAISLLSATLCVDPVKLCVRLSACVAYIRGGTVSHSFGGIA